MMLPAFLACYLSATFGIPGLLSLVQLAAFAVSAAALKGYRSEPGLWMLAALFFVLWCGVFGLCLCGDSRRVARRGTTAGIGRRRGARNVPDPVSLEIPLEDDPSKFRVLSRVSFE